MIVTFKNRIIKYNKPVFVYRNLNNKLYKYSVMQNNRVVGHTNQIMLVDVEFVVREFGRRKVITERRKNVHAFIKGRWTYSYGGKTENDSFYCKISYNPYICGYFVDLENKPVRGAKAAILNVFGVSAQDLIYEKI